MPDWLLTSWYWFGVVAVFAADLFATAHVLLKKRDTQAAIGWAGMIWQTETNAEWIVRPSPSGVKRASTSVTRPGS